MAAVAVDGHFDDRPDLGLYIRRHEIVDERNAPSLAKAGIFCCLLMEYYALPAH